MNNSSEQILPPASQLSLVKRLILESTKHDVVDDPVAAGMAISLMQDAVELYVWTLIKERNISVREQSGFLANLDALSKSEIEMPFASKLRELNRARVGFKHYGNLPATSEAQKFRMYVEEALREATKQHFRICFDDISMADLIVNQQVRAALSAAEIQLSAQQYREAASELAKAKTYIFREMQTFVPKVGLRIREMNPEVSVHLEDLREAVLISLFRLPFAEYSYIQRHLPSAFESMAGTWQFTHRANLYTEETCRRSIASIIKLGLSIQSRY